MATSDTNVYLAGIPLTMTEPELEAMLSRFGPIVSHRILNEAGTKVSRGIGFANFSRAEHAKAAIDTLNNTTLPLPDGGETKALVVRLAKDPGSRDDGYGPRRGGPENNRFNPMGRERGGRRESGWDQRGDERFGGRMDFRSPPPPGRGAYDPFFSARPANTGQSMSPFAKKVGGSLPPAKTEEEAKSNIYIAGVPKSFKKEDVEALFGKYGKITSSKVLFDALTREPRGIAFVRFSRLVDAQTAIAQLNNVIAEGGDQPMQIRFAREPGQDQKQIYEEPQYQQAQEYYGAPPQMQPQGFDPYQPYAWPGYPPQQPTPSSASLEQQYAQYLSATSSMPEQKQPAQQTPTPFTSLPPPPPPPPPNSDPNDPYVRAYADYFAYYQQQQAQHQAQQQQMLPPMQQQMPSSPSSGFDQRLYIPPPHLGLGGPPPSTSRPSGYTPPNCCLFVVHLPLEFTEEDLMMLAKNYGSVASVKIMTTPGTNQSRGFGFVNFQSPDEAQVALNGLNGYAVAGKRLKVSFKAAGNKPSGSSPTTPTPTTPQKSEEN